MKKIMVQFDFPKATSQQYDSIWDDLRASGNGNPEGLIYHFGAAKPDGGWTVVDMWESEKAFQKFGAVLMPLIQKNNLPMVQPAISHVHNVYDVNKQKAMA